MKGEYIVFDNHGYTADRYFVIDVNNPEYGLALSTNCNMPNGVSMWIENTGFPDGDLISPETLPQHIKEHMEQRFKE